MEGIIFMGIQATGKSSFYKEFFFDTHVRISLDQLNTRNKEAHLLQACLEFQQKVVVDNTNPTLADRERYIPHFKQRHYRVIGYYFQSEIEKSLARNALREGKKRVPDVRIRATYSHLTLPSFEEGFDQLFYVSLSQEGFSIQPWKHEV